MSTKMRVVLIRKLIWSLENIFFYPKLSKFYKKYNVTSESKIILDIGSNRGQSIDFFLKVFSNIEIIGMEPNKEIFKFLQKKYLHYPNIELINKGASDENGLKKFQINQLDETSTFEKLNFDSEFLKKKAKILGVSANKIVKKEIFVDVIKLADLLKSKGIINVFLLKIDVEGHELSVLNGLFVDSKDCIIQNIQLENHQDDMYLNNSFQKIEALLLENSYFLSHSIKHVFGDFSENIYSLNNEA